MICLYRQIFENKKKFHSLSLLIFKISYRNIIILSLIFLFVKRLITGIKYYIKTINIIL